MTDTPDRDPCAELGRIGPPPPTDRLRADLWRRLQSRLRRRRWWRRAAVAAALAACYLAGFGTARLAPEPAPVGERPTPRNEIQELYGGSQVFAQAPPSPLAQEWQALDSPEQRPAAYREALDAGSDKDLAVAPEDNWLLIALKGARQKEKRYANRND